MAANLPFPSSHWSLIAEAQGQGPEARVALSKLVERYHRTITCLLQRRRLPPHLSPEDLRQDFLLGVTRRGDVIALDPARGRFRAWLYCAVSRHVSNAWKEYYRLSGGFRLTDAAENLEISSTDCPEAACLAAEALDTFSYVRDRLRETAKDPERFEVLQRLLPNGQLEVEGDRAAAAAALGMSPNTLSVAIWHLKAEFRQVLFEAVADTMRLNPRDPNSRQEIEIEMRLMYRALCENASTSSRLGV